jgi:hypothetical protein
MFYILYNLTHVARMRSIAGVGTFCFRKKRWPWACYTYSFQPVGKQAWYAIPPGKRTPDGSLLIAEMMRAENSQQAMRLYFEVSKPEERHG